jgi:hypothetical protein
VPWIDLGCWLGTHSYNIQREPYSQVLWNAKDHRRGYNICPNTGNNWDPWDPGTQEPMPRQWHWFLPVWACALSRPWALAPHSVSQHSEQARVSGALTCPGSQVRRSQYLPQNLGVTGTPQGSRDAGTPTQLVAQVPSGLSLCPEQTLYDWSAPIPTISRGSPTPRCSEMPWITGSQRKLDSQESWHTLEHWSSGTLKITAEATRFVTIPSRVLTLMEPGKNKPQPSQRHRLLLACTCALRKPRAVAPHTPKESLTPRSSDTPRISGL